MDRSDPARLLTGDKLMAQNTTINQIIFLKEQMGRSDLARPLAGDELTT